LNTDEHSAKGVCVYCGSGPGARPEYRAAATRFGALLAERGLPLVYGGGSSGLMGAVADGVLAGGGQAVGVVPRGLFPRESVHTSLSERIMVADMHERKAVMVARSAGFVALPGGIGTLDEVIEVWTWNQLGIIKKPIGLLNVKEYFNPLLALMDKMVAEQFFTQRCRELPLVTADPERLLEHLLAPNA